MPLILFYKTLSQFESNDLLRISEQLEYEYEHGPCGKWRPGDADLNTFDLIREFRLDQSEIQYESVERIQGSDLLQTAYSLRRESNLTM